MSNPLAHQRLPRPHLSNDQECLLLPHQRAHFGMNCIVTGHVQRLDGALRLLA
jgi:hypothetical protein